jgi:hypothetical protein
MKLNIVEGDHAGRAGPHGVRGRGADRSVQARDREGVTTMADIKDPRLLYAKGALFVLGGIMAAGLILVEHPTIKVALLLAIAIWCFARAYYFAFYVIEHYVDPGYKFAGLWAFTCYVLGKRHGKRGP